jgi:hypothetical protein
MYAACTRYMRNLSTLIESIVNDQERTGVDECLKQEDVYLKTQLVIDLSFHSLA